MPRRGRRLTASKTYELFAQAIEGRQQIVCSYSGHIREICPVLLGHTRGEETALTFQFAGGSGSGLPKGGEWRCLTLSKVVDARLRDGPWMRGESHRRPQGCVETVEYDVNPRSPYVTRRD